MTKIETLYLQYYSSVSKQMMADGSPFIVMSEKINEQFKLMGLINEEKAKALVDVYLQQVTAINAEASKAALQLLKQEDDTLLNDAKVATEERKRQGYDDNILIEIMKAQGGLASFAVNAAAESAQDTIDDLHEIMGTVEDRVCDLVCSMPSFEQDVVTDYQVVYNGEVYGGSGLTYAVYEAPEKGVLAVGTDGTYSYTPQNNAAGVGSFKGIITATDDANGIATATTLKILVSDIVGA